MTIAALTAIRKPRPSLAGQAVGFLSFPGGPSANDDGCIRIVRPNTLGSGFMAFGGWVTMSPGSNTQTGVTENANYSGVQGPIWVDDDDTTDAGVIAGLTGGRLYLSINVPGVGQRTRIATTDIRDSNPHHVEAQRFVNGLMRLLVDGVVEDEFSGPAGDISHAGHPSSTNGGIYIGIEKLRITNGLTHGLSEFYVLDQEIHTVTDGTYSVPTAPLSPQAGIVGLYHFAEDPADNAGVVVDSSGAGNHGETEGSPLPTWAPDGPF